MRIADTIALNAPFFSLEFFPPKEESKRDAFYAEAEMFREIEPAFVSVTCGAGGGERNGTLPVAQELQKRLGVPAMAHLTCVQSTPEYLDGLLEDCREAGIDNFLALRGDLPEGMTEPSGPYRHASDLVEYLRAKSPDLGIGVAAYPCPHPESESVERDLGFLAKKFNAGGDLGITQLFFDPRVYFDMVDRLRALGCNQPVIPGVLPIRSMASIRRILSLCEVPVPGRFYLELERAYDEGGDEVVRTIGMDFAVKQCVALIKGGAPGVHLYTLNKADMCLEIVRRVREAL